MPDPQTGGGYIGNKPKEEPDFKPTYVKIWMAIGSAYVGRMRVHYRDVGTKKWTFHDQSHPKGAFSGGYITVPGGKKQKEILVDAQGLVGGSGWEWGVIKWRTVRRFEFKGSGRYTERKKCFAMHGDAYRGVNTYYANEDCVYNKKLYGMNDYNEGIVLSQPIMQEE
ncbi:hypothetical protein GCM10023116_49770 [Kistimonas scapharcae]|uniref:Uncharacterized protein n=1 Tax=Kistimonas scapharcae TaxID=1036133 RepID=A0ABP8V8W3_9GAMM